MKAIYTIKNERHTGEIVKSNHKTVWVKALDGKIVKRHKVKHNVEVVDGN